MKYGRIRITVDNLARLLGLPDGAEIVSAWQDSSDLAQRSVSLSIRGAGVEIVEGAEIPVLSLVEVERTRLVTNGSGYQETETYIGTELV
jgi:hypothetical protein